jgi:hypothetical protein
MIFREGSKLHNGAVAGAGNGPDHVALLVGGERGANGSGIEVDHALSVFSQRQDGRLDKGVGRCLVGAADLEKFANLADAAAKTFAQNWRCESWHDGHAVHAPVGTFAANAFGLHDVHGNVLEWCRDWEGDYGSERAGDGLRSVGSSPVDRCYRGGSFNFPAFDARSAYRIYNTLSVRGSNLGLRPARPFTPIVAPGFFAFCTSIGMPTGW